MYSFYLIPLLTRIRKSLRIDFEYIINYFYNFLTFLYFLEKKDYVLILFNTIINKNSQIFKNRF